MPRTAGTKHTLESRRMVFLQGRPPRDTCFEVRATQSWSSLPVPLEQTHQPSTKSHLPPQPGLGKSFCRLKRYLLTQRDPLNRAESLVTLPDPVLFLPCMFWRKLLPTQTSPCSLGRLSHAPGAQQQWCLVPPQLQDQALGVQPCRASLVPARQWGTSPVEELSVHSMSGAGCS